MAGFQILTPVEIETLNREMDIFRNAPGLLPELVFKGLYPPLPICAGTLLWGFEILRTAKKQGMRKLSCLIIPSCERAEQLSLALKLENRAGRFSWPEKEGMLDYLRPHRRSGGPSPQLIGDFERLSPLIETHRDPQLAEKITVYAALPPALKQLVAAGRVDLKTAERVRSLPGEVFEALSDSALSFSRSRQLLNELFEVSRGRELTDLEIKEAARQALREPQPLETIHRMRFPTLTSLKSRFAAIERQLLKGSGVKLIPPPYFEGEAYTLELSFNSTKTFARKLRALESLQGRLDALLELLH